MRKLIGLAGLAALASCVAPPPKPPPTPPPARQPAPALPAAAPQQDWRDVPLTPGRWLWRGGAGQASLSQFGVPGEAAAFALRCDSARATIVFSRVGSLGAGATSMTITTSFGTFAVPVRDGGGAPPAILAELPARDPRLDQMAFSRGRFLIDVPGQPRLVIPAWPEVARVIEDCRG
jgi:hypothetical protein